MHAKHRIILVTTPTIQARHPYNDVVEIVAGSNNYRDWSDAVTPPV